MRIVKSSLHLEAADRIRTMIVEGELEPGSRIQETDLCERFGISRTPLREALKVLAADGMIALPPNRGAWVVELTLEDLRAMFQVMGSLEGLAGELACQRINHEQLSNVRALHNQMLVHYNRGERSAYFRLNQQIHEAIIAAASNPVLSQMYGSLSGRIQRTRYLANTDRERWAQAVEEHEQMLAALEARDGPRLGEILRLHLAHKFDTVGAELTPEQAQ